MLKPLGFRRLYNVEGGTAAWLAAGYPVEKPTAAI
jgi:rhodanese-related sulfurtransferase